MRGKAAKGKNSKIKNMDVKMQKVNLTTTYDTHENAKQLKNASLHTWGMWVFGVCTVERFASY